jgi:hypothetical protein
MKKKQAHRSTPECVGRSVAAVVAYLPHAHTPVQGHQRCAVSRYCSSMVWVSRDTVKSTKTISLADMQLLSRLTSREVNIS